MEVMEIVAPKGFLDVTLVYCRALNKHLAVPPGTTELILGTVPMFSCYDCDKPCSLRAYNQEYLTDLMQRILNSGDSHSGYFIGLLHQYKERHNTKHFVVF